MKYISKTGFTLIELLIVVAIIAILAAIAVPNFLEAQMRAKITRTMADMRSVAVAIESYTVDNNQVPINTDGEFAIGYLTIQPYNRRLSDYVYPPLMTTPIAYISSMPIDPFNSGAIRAHVGVDAPLVGQWINVTGLNRHPWPKPGQGYWGQVGPHTFHWFMTSAGPDQAFYGAPYPDAIYDPTNGTVSGGDISYINTIGFTGSGRK